MEIRAFVFEKDSGRSSKMTPSCKCPISLKKIKKDSNKVGLKTFEVFFYFFFAFPIILGRRFCLS